VPDLTVVVVTHNSRHVIEPLLDSLPAALGDLGADVVVVDNASTDGTASLVEARSDCLVVRSANVGYAAGLNAGVRSGRRTDALLLLNPDVVLSPGSVPWLMKNLSLPATGIVAPRVEDANGLPQPSLRREPSVLRSLGLTRTALPAFSEYLSRPQEYETAQVVDWALGAALLVSRACYDDLDGLDESYFLYSEETDFCLRAKDRGWVTRYEPRATVMHVGGQSGQSGRTHAMRAVNRVRLYRRRHNAVASAAFLALAVAFELSWVARGGSWEPVESLLGPSRRPEQLGCSQHLLPR